MMQLQLQHDRAAGSRRRTVGRRARGAILALDLGTTTGWALRAPDGLITSGTVSFRPSRYDGGGMRYLRFRSWLTELDRATPARSPRFSTRKSADMSAPTPRTSTAGCWRR